MENYWKEYASTVLRVGQEFEQSHPEVEAFTKAQEVHAWEDWSLPKIQAIGKASVHFALIAITCIVVSQSKIKGGQYRTECQGKEVNAFVIFDKRIVKGQAVDYRPFIRIDDEDIHGDIISIHNPLPEKPQAEQVSSEGKRPT